MNRIKIEVCDFNLQNQLNIFNEHFSARLFIYTFGLLFLDDVKHQLKIGSQRILENLATKTVKKCSYRPTKCTTMQGQQ